MWNGQTILNYMYLSEAMIPDSKGNSIRRMVIRTAITLGIEKL